MDDAEKYRRLQAQVANEAYKERFGMNPETPGDLEAALDAGLLDNLPLTTDGKIDARAWKQRHR